MAESEKKDKVVTQETAEKVPEKAKKVNSRDKRIAELEKELSEQKDLLLRTAAEFDNYKRRTDKERLGMAEYVKAQALKPLLPVFDNLDRASEITPDSAEYVKGIEMIVKQLNEAVGKLGLESIGEIGDKFDPNIHEAVMHIEDAELPENSISQVMQKGYKVGDTVIRPAMVQVAN